MPFVNPRPQSAILKNMETPPDSDISLRILRHLARVHAENERAEVALLEVEKELGLSHTQARAAVTRLVREGLAHADLFPLHVWVIITPEGLSRVGETGT